MSPSSNTWTPLHMSSRRAQELYLEWVREKESRKIMKHSRRTKGNPAQRKRGVISFWKECCYFRKRKAKTRGTYIVIIIVVITIVIIVIIIITITEQWRSIYQTMSGLINRKEIAITGIFFSSSGGNDHMCPFTVHLCTYLDVIILIAWAEPQQMRLMCAGRSV